MGYGIAVLTVLGIAVVTVWWVLKAVWEALWEEESDENIHLKQLDAARALAAAKGEGKKDQ